MTPMPDNQGKFPTMASGQTRTLEREVKFDAPLSLPLPDLPRSRGADRATPRTAVRTAYFDTADGRLWNQGLTLRHRTVDGESIGTWTLKLPEAINGPNLERTEVSWTGGGKASQRRQKARAWAGQAGAVASAGGARSSAAPP